MNSTYAANVKMMVYTNNFQMKKNILMDKNNQKGF